MNQNNENMSREEKLGRLACHVLAIPILIFIAVLIIALLSAIPGGWAFVLLVLAITLAIKLIQKS